MSPCGSGYGGKKSKASGAMGMGRMKAPPKAAMPKAKPKVAKGSGMKSPMPRPAAKGKAGIRKRMA